MNTNTSGSKKLYQIIINSILEKIEKNEFSFETPICTESQLMEEFQVSRITAKRAITELEYQGILYRKRGVGSFVARDIFQKKGQKNNTPTVFAFLLPFTIKQENVFNMIAKINGKISTANCFLSLFVTDGSRSKERSILKQLLEQNIAGLLFYPVSSDIHLDLLNQFVFRSVPVIIYDQPVTAPYLYNVLCDNVMGAAKLTEHLIALGHEKISFFSINNMVSVASIAERLGGYLQAMEAAGLSPNPDHIVSHLSDSTEDALRRRLQDLINLGITAIVCENDGVAAKLIQVCRSLSLRVPEDISICGFCNDFDSITSIYQNERLMADSIGDIFLESVSHTRTVPHKVLVPPILYEKASTGPVPEPHK